MKQNGSLCAAPQVTFHAWRSCQHLCCVTWSHASLMRELRGWTSLGSIETWKVVLGRLLQQRSPLRREWKMSPYVRTMGRMQMMRMWMRRARAAQVPCNKALTLPIATLTGATTLVAGLNRASQGMGRMVPLGDSPQVKTVKARGRVKWGIHQPQHPPHCVSRSPPVSQWRHPQRFWQPQRQCPLQVTFCL